jgi:hypothetical protein
VTTRRGVAHLAIDNFPPELFIPSVEHHRLELENCRELWPRIAGRGVAGELGVAHTRTTMSL